MEIPLEVDVNTAAALLKEGALLLDVREPDEVATCAIVGSVRIPMQQVPQSLAELPRDRRLLVHCHHGGRSLRVTQFLRAQGYALASNVAGGIDVWAQEIEPGMARY